MAETLENIYTLIKAVGMKIGNIVVSATTGGPTTANANMVTDANGALQIKVPATVVQPTVTSEVLTVTGTAAANMVSTIVNGADATTFTSAGFIRVNVTDTAGRLTGGFYYLQIGTLT